MQAKKMNVLQVLPALESGGVERGTLEVARYLTSLGHGSFVISAGGRMVDQLLAEGSEHFTMPIGKKSLLTLCLVPELIRFIKQHQIDIVHVRSRFPAWICKIAIGRMVLAERPKLITTVHGQYSVSRYSRIMTSGDEVIVISKAIKAYVQKHYPVQAKKLHLNYRGIDPIQFPYQYQPAKEWLDAWSVQYPHLQSKFIVTLPGRITRWKGQEDLCEMIAILKEKIPHIHGLIVGEVKQGKQDYCNEIKAKVNALGLENHITFTGYRNDVREIMAISDVVVSLSHEPEAFGRVTIEALAMGVPVIAYAHGGVKEQLDEVFPQGRVKPKNYLEATRRILEWVDNKPTVAPTKAFHLQTMLETTLKVYQKALAQQKGNS